jgi:uncharacterized protein YbaR (Trm112 family)
MEKKLFEILVCPLCKGKLKFDKKNNELVCSFDHIAYPIREDIPIMLENEARKIKKDSEV